MIISIIVLTAILIAAQLILSIKQIKKGAPDGRTLLIITIVFSVIWIPLSVFRLIYSLTPLKISWFIITVVYNLQPRLQRLRHGLPQVCIHRSR